MSPTLHDLARYYQHFGLVGEDRAAITSSVALAGEASVIWKGYPGTGKTHAADITVALLPEDIVARVDMVSKLGIWSKKAAERLAAAKIVYFPEDQNAGDNDEVVKVKKKWGDGKAAEREKSADFGNDTELTVLPPRTFISTAAITNEAHERSFDLESARRVVKVNTDPSETATKSVLDSKADRLVRGDAKVRVLNPLDLARVKRHVAKVMTLEADRVRAVRFFGARELIGAIPKTFPESRSAFALFEKVLLGIARWYADDELLVNGEVYLSPQRVAEAWAFYGGVLMENALKWETSDREILSAFPNPTWNGEAPAPDCCYDLPTVMRKLKPFGLTDQALVKRQVFRLIAKGFLSEAGGFRTTRWHRTNLADVANFVDWEKVIAACEAEAPKHLTGVDLENYQASTHAARGSHAMMNPLTGQRGPIVGEASVLHFDSTTGSYTPVGVTKSAPAKGIMAYGATP